MSTTVKSSTSAGTRTWQTLLDLFSDCESWATETKKEDKKRYCFFRKFILPITRKNSSFTLSLWNVLMSTSATKIGSSVFRFSVEMSEIKLDFEKELNEPINSKNHILTLGCKTVHNSTTPSIRYFVQFDSKCFYGNLKYVSLWLFSDFVSLQFSIWKRK